MEKQNKKILLVEDDPNFGTVLKDYLTMNDYDVIHAKNGMEGFEKFKKDHFDLCILDVMMPYKDGFTLAKEIREKNQDVPIIFLTAKAMKEDVLKGYKIGADDYLNKPFDSEVLLMKIKAIIQRKSSETKGESKLFDFKFGAFQLNAKLRYVITLLQLLPLCPDALRYPPDSSSKLTHSLCGTSLSLIDSSSCCRLLCSSFSLSFIMLCINRLRLCCIRLT